MGGMRRNRGGEIPDERTVENTRPAVASRLDQVTARLYDLRIRLQLTPEQTPLWESFHTQAIQLITAVPGWQYSPDESSALQAMQRQLTIAQNRYTLTENLYGATKVLYDSLNPDQQRIADQGLPQAVLISGGDADRRTGVRNGSRY